jgi:tRNA (guanine37-N1)-methyltransferase
MFAATVLTLYPEMFPGPLGTALAGQGLQKGLWSLETVDIRGFARDKHRSVDDTPAGGGPGMVMRADILAAAIDAVSAGGPRRPLVYLSPRGVPLTQERLRTWSEGPGVVLVCGRFEGMDERIVRARPGEEVSLGDFVLSGGEPAALALLDGVVRLLPGVMGKTASMKDESFENGLLEYPHYTRPRQFEGEEIPEVLLSGDHAAIAAWRRGQAEAITKARRPDLFTRYQDRKKAEPDSAERQGIDHERD